MMYDGYFFLLVLILLGLSIGCICSIVGLGGGVLVIPASILILNLSAKEAVFTSLLTMSGITISATLRYIYQRKVNYRIGTLYNILDVPGVIVGAFLTTMITNNLVLGICGGIIILISLLLFRDKEKQLVNIGKKDKIKDPERVSKLEINNPLAACLSSFSGGVLTGVAGLGGGTTDTTSMILLGMDSKRAAATSEFSMAMTSVFGLFSHLALGTFQSSWMIPIMLTIGGVLGAQMGTSISKRADGRKVKKGVACLTFYTGSLLIFMMFEIAQF